MDVRQGTYVYNGKDRRVVKVEPDTLGSVTSIPYPDSHFTLVIYDPPHDRYGYTSYMCKKYGSMTVEKLAWITELANLEFYRVLKPGGILLVKCQNNEDRDKVITEKLYKFKLLLKIEQARLSQKGKGKYKTYWMVFYRGEN